MIIMIMESLWKI